MGNLDDLQNQLKDFQQRGDLASIKTIDSIQSILSKQEEENQKLFKSIDEQNAEKRRLVYEREAREKESLGIQKEALDLQKLMLFFMQSINRDNKQIIENIHSLIEVIDFGFNVEEGNLALIERELKAIKENTENVQKKFIDVVKEKMAEKGVEYAVMYMLVGLKSLFLNN